MDWPQNKLERKKSVARQNTCHQRIEKTRKRKRIQIILGAIQYLSKYIENLWAKTDILRQLLKNDTEWKWTEEQTEAFEILKQINLGDTVFGCL